MRFVDFQRANVNNFFFLAAQTSGIYGLNVFGVEVAFCDFQDGNFAGWGFVYEVCGIYPKKKKKKKK